MKKFIFISILLLNFGQLLYGQNPFITNYSIANGLPTNLILCAMQDRNGFIWFGTNAGVLRYDGTSFVHYTEKDGLSPRSTFRIKEDKKGRIWFLNIDGSTNFYHNNNIYNAENRGFLSEIKTSFAFHDMFQDTDSTLYFYNNAAEIYVTKHNKYIDFTIAGDPNKGLFSISKTRNGNLLFWKKNEVIELKNIDHVLKTHPLNFFAQRTFCLEDGLTYVCDMQGNIHIFRDLTLIKRNFITVPSRTINDILIDNEYTWISTFDKGVFCYKNDSLVYHLDIDKAQNLILDNQNNIWTVSNTYGIYKINRDILRYKTIGTENFDYRGITDIAPSNQNGIWLTNGKSLYWFKNGKLLGNKLSISENILDNIIQLKDNTLILNGRGTNLHVIKNVTVIPNKNLINFEKSTTFSYFVKKAVVGTDENKLYCYLDNKLIILDIHKIRTKLKGLNWGRISNIFFSKSDNLVVNAEFNITYREDAIFKRDQIYTKFDGQQIRSNIVLDKENEILNINGKQLILHHKDQLFDIIKENNEQIGHKILDIAYDGTTLFFYTVKTVYFITNPTKVVKGESVKINRLNIEFNNISDIFCQDETLYIASDNGLTYIPVSECVNAITIPTKPYFSNVYLNDEIVDLSESKVTFKNKNRLKIEFSSLNFSSTLSQYAYMLEGIDKEWITGDEKEVVYLNLRPGRYTFKLKSRKNLEEYSEVIELPIEVVPTFYQLIITKVFAVLVLLLICVLLIRQYYKRQIRLKEKDHQLVTLENRALQSMMNPHFIFNSLGSIQKFLLQNKAEEAGSYLSQFARLIRQTMNSIKSNHVQLDDEIERLRNYIELEQLRMDSRFKYNIIVDEELLNDDFNIPSMIVQPFVENAIWHGISPLQEPGIIEVRFSYINEKSIGIEITDNGIGFKKSKVFSKAKDNLNMASTLTQKRIQLIGEKYKVQTSIKYADLYPEKENPGAKVKLTVPIV